MQKSVATFVLLAALNVVLLVIGSTPAVAGSSQDPFTFTTADGDNAYMTLVLGTPMNGVYPIESLSGTYFDAGPPGMTSTELSLIPVDQFPGHPNDNLFYLAQGGSGGAYLGAEGFAFQATFPNGDVEDYVVFYTGTGPTGYEGCTELPNGGCMTVQITEISPTAPEPSSILLFGTGAFAVLASIRRKLRT